MSLNVLVHWMVDTLDIIVCCVHVTDTTGAIDRCN